MSNLNICSFICKNADSEKQIIESIINEIELPTNKRNDLYLTTIISGIEISEEDIYLDFFLNCVGDIEDKAKPKFAHLFFLSIHQEEIDPDENSQDEARIYTKLSQYENYFFKIVYSKINVSFPYKGFYEIEVFRTLRKPEGLWKDRYKNYKEQGQKPVSVYNFCVK